MTSMICGLRCRRKWFLEGARNGSPGIVCRPCCDLSLQGAHCPQNWSVLSFFDKAYGINISLHCINLQHDSLKKWVAWSNFEPPLSIMCTDERGQETMLSFIQKFQMIWCNHAQWWCLWWFIIVPLSWNIII